jgi:hypothetical protein
MVRAENQSLKNAYPDFFTLPNGNKVGEIYLSEPKAQINTLRRLLHSFIDMEAHGDISIVYENIENYFSAETIAEIMATSNPKEIDRFLQKIVKLSFYSLGVKFINAAPEWFFLKGLSESDGKSAAQLLRSKKSAPQREIIVFNPNAKREQYIKTAKRNRDLMGRHKRIKIVDPGVKFIID